MRPAQVWGYDGIYPGPTFDVRSGTPISVKWLNKLPEKHLLPIDHTIHGAENSVPDVRTVVHLHGHKVLPESDGYPEAWFTRDFQETGPYFATETYRYPNEQPAMTLFYHDHALGITRLNVYAGLSGFYLIHDQVEDELPLPRGRFDIPLIIQDRSFNSDGSLMYPDQGVTPFHPIWVPEFFGDTAVVNGRVMPHLDVEPRKYRFRILNASNARFYQLRLSSGQPFIQIGSDQGFLPKPVPSPELLLAPAERADVVIDFTRMRGRSITLTNSAPAPFPGGDPEVPPVAQIMQFRVMLPLTKPDSPLPDTLAPVPLLDPTDAAQVRSITLEELEDPNNGNPIRATLEGRMWDAPVVENPRAGSIEVWQLINTTEDAHPIHVHLVRFQVLDRQPFDIDQFMSSNGQQLVFTGPPMPPPPSERPAWKDTVRADPGFVTRIIARFELPSTAIMVPGKPFRYVFHCHILEHEENEMMRPYDVRPAE
jgi:spore coat protein A